MFHILSYLIFYFFLIYIPYCLTPTSVTPSYVFLKWRYLLLESWVQAEKTLTSLCTSAVFQIVDICKSWKETTLSLFIIPDRCSMSFQLWMLNWYAVNSLFSTMGVLLCQFISHLHIFFLCCYIITAWLIFGPCFFKILLCSLSQSPDRSASIITTEFQAVRHSQTTSFRDIFVFIYSNIALPWLEMTYYFNASSFQLLN